MKKQIELFFELDGEELPKNGTDTITMKMVEHLLNTIPDLELKTRLVDTEETKRAKINKKYGYLMR